jgi:hypothetical protein
MCNNNFKKYNNNNKNTTTLIKYGDHIGSTLGTGKLNSYIKNSIRITLDRYSIIVGLLLSDGWLEKSSLNSNTRLKFKQSIKRSDYVLDVFMKMIPYCSSIPYLLSSNRKGFTHFGLEFRTRQLPCLNEFYDLFYKNKIKSVPKNIHSLLTPLALAHWIMGDGASLNKGLVLCTDSFKLEEVKLLQFILKNKFEINSTIQGLNSNRSRIYIIQESMPKLINLVKPFILPTMQYKLHLK